MPFKTLSSARKLQDLGSEVSAAAYLSNPGHVAVLGRDPARLALFPTTGTGGKVTNVDLEGAAAVALLSRDVAVVRTADDAVWTLSDILHSAKVDQVARDCRALCPNPAGTKALALSWDGGGVELTLDRNDVESRWFPIRGSIRACDLTETETFTVVDGDDGGQVRVHPGSTPEPGASLRCNLPAEAATFDRIRGGARLSVVFKPGHTTVCVLMGGPHRLAARLVELPQPAIDLAVVDTSLVAVFPDGRAALFDSEAVLTAMENGALTPRHSISLGLSAEPTVLVATSRGGPSIWVGSSAGEISSAALVRKSGM